MWVIYFTPFVVNTSEFILMDRTGIVLTIIGLPLALCGFCLLYIVHRKNES